MRRFNLPGLMISLGAYLIAASLLFSACSAADEPPKPSCYFDALDYRL